MFSLTFAASVILATLAGIFLFVRSANKWPPVLLLIFLAYTIFSVNVSVFFLDTNEIYISETDTVSESSLAWVRLFFFNALIFFGIFLGICFFPTQRLIPNRLSINPPPSVHTWVALGLIFGIMTLAAINVLLSNQIPFPGSGYSRQTFWEERIRFSAIRDLFGVLLFFVPFVCAASILYANKNRNEGQLFFAKSLLFGYFLYLLISGQVFHGLLLPASVVAGILALKKVEAGETILRLRTFLLVWPIAAAFAYFIVSLSFEGREISKSFASLPEAIAYRVLALQGSTYWQCDHIWGFQGSIGSVTDLLSGRQFLIESIMPPDLANSYLDGGVNLQGALPGTALLTVGFWGSATICLFFGLIFGLISNQIVGAIAAGRIFVLFPLSYLWLWTLSAYSRASLEEIASVKFAAFSLLTALYLVAPKKEKLFQVDSLAHQNQA